MEPRILYKCDPAKNTKCNKKLCFIYGGKCRNTKNLDYAQQPVKTILMQFPMSEEDFKAIAEGKKKYV